jgi:hypothetical protein
MRKPVRRQLARVESREVGARRRLEIALAVDQNQDLTVGRICLVGRVGRDHADLSEITQPGFLEAGPHFVPFGRARVGSNGGTHRSREIGDVRREHVLGDAKLRTVGRMGGRRNAKPRAKNGGRQQMPARGVRHAHSRPRFLGVMPESLCPFDPSCADHAGSDLRCE